MRAPQDGADNHQGQDWIRLYFCESDTWGLVVNGQEPNDTAATTTAVAEIAGREAANDVDLSRLLVFWFVLSQVTYCFFGQSSSAESYRR